MDNAAKEKPYKSPARKLVRFFEKSRDQWKSKHHQAGLMKRGQKQASFQKWPDTIFVPGDYHG